jgi:hypothetical protein
MILLISRGDAIISRRPPLVPNAPVGASARRVEPVEEHALRVPVQVVVEHFRGQSSATASVTVRVMDSIGASDAKMTFCLPRVRM